MSNPFEKAKTSALAYYGSFHGMDQAGETSEDRDLLRGSIRNMTEMQMKAYLAKLSNGTLTAEDKHQRMGEAAQIINHLMQSSGGRRGKSRTRRGKRRGRKTRRSYV